MSEGEVYTFDPGKDVEFKPGVPRSVSMQDSPGQMDNGAVNEANQLTTEANPWLAQEAQAAQPVQAQAAPQVDPRDEEIKQLKKIMGDQGNQIGEYRKVLAQLAAQQQAPAQPPPYYSTPVQGGRLIETNPDEYPTAKQIEAGLLRAGQVIYESLQAQIQEQAAKAQLLASGVTPEEQQLLDLQYPGLRNMDPQTRVSVTSALISAKRANGQAAAAQVAQTAQAGVRQQVYVPQTQPITNIPQSGAQIDMDAFGNLPNSAQMEKALKTLGVGRVNDFNRRG